MLSAGRPAGLIFNADGRSAGEAPCHHLNGVHGMTCNYRSWSTYKHTGVLHTLLQCRRQCVAEIAQNPEVNQSVSLFPEQAHKIDRRKK